VVAFECGFEIACLETNRPDRLLAHLGTRTISNAEAAFTGTVDEMGGGAKVIAQLSVGFNRSQRRGRAPITVFANQSVNLSVFAELLQARGEDNQFASVGHRHSGAIDRLVAQP